MTAPTSRLIVRNLPPNTTQTSLSEHFLSLPSSSSAGALDASSSAGAGSARLTDVKLMHKRDGTFRRFAFVGYKSALDAQRARDYFDGTFIGSSRIAVEFAKGIAEAAADGAKHAAKRERASGVAAGAQDAAADGRSAKRRKGEADSADKGAAAGTASAKSKGKRPAGAKEVTFEEFMAVMQPKAKRKTWANEEAPTHADGKGSKGASAALAGAADDDGDDSDVQDLTGVDKRKEKEEKRARKIARKEEKRRKKEAEAQAARAAAAASEPSTGGASGGDAGEGDDSASEAGDANKDAEMTDAEYFASRMRRNVGAEFEQAAATAAAKDDSDSDSDSSSSGSDSASDSDASSASGSSGSSAARLRTSALRAARAEERARARKEAALRAEQEAVDTIMQTSRLMVRNLPFATTEEELQAWFEKWGEVSFVRIPVDKSSKQSKGIGFVTFANATDALQAYRANDGSTFQGRLLHLLPAVDQHPEGLPAPVSASKKSLKEQKLEERRRRAAEGKDTFNWSSFYMSADAVADSIAQRMGISKNDIVNPGDDAGTSAAVRLALAETKVIQETKEFLRKNGVNLDALEGAGADEGARRRRNDCVILIKNFPFGTTEAEIRSLFARFGDVETVLLPPAGTFAMVEMPVPNEAREAFRALAYTRFKDKPVYLEKAPEGIFVSKTGAASAAAAAKQAPGSKLAAKLGGADEDDAADEGARAAAATIFVKNLSFATTDARLADAFGHLPNFVFARVQTKTSNAPAGKTPVKLSMGYGFVGFRTAADAKAAIETMQGTALDGHVLSLKFAHQDASAMAQGGGGSGSAAGTSSHGGISGAGGARGSSTTLLVKNLPFEASKKEVRQLFEAHGQVKSVRVPKKLDKSARGFGFVEFASRREAASAMEALRHTHLLGRHLVLKWAQDDDGAGVGAGASGAGVGSDGLERARNKARAAAAAQASAPEMGGARRAKMRLGAEDIAKAAAQERQRRDDVEDEEDEGEAA